MGELSLREVKLPRGPPVLASPRQGSHFLTRHQQVTAVCSDSDHTCSPACTSQEDPFPATHTGSEETRWRGEVHDRLWAGLQQRWLLGLVRVTVDAP